MFVQIICPKEDFASLFRPRLKYLQECQFKLSIFCTTSHQYYPHDIIIISVCVCTSLNGHNRPLKHVNGTARIQSQVLLLRLILYYLDTTVFEDSRKIISTLGFLFYICITYVIFTNQKALYKKFYALMTLFLLALKYYG